MATCYLLLCACFTLCRFSFSIHPSVLDSKDTKIFFNPAREWRVREISVVYFTHDVILTALPGASSAKAHLFCHTVTLGPNQTMISAVRKPNQLFFSPTVHSNNKRKWNSMTISHINHHRLLYLGYFGRRNDSWQRCKEPLDKRDTDTQD